jgi:hypothetical protein
VQPNELLGIVTDEREETMQPTDNIEKLLSETPVPSVQDGLHRAALKRELLAQMQTMEKSMAEQPQQSGLGLSLPTPPKPRRRITPPQWIAAAVAAAVVVVAGAIIAVKQTAHRPVVAPPEPTEVAAADSSDKIEVESLVVPPRPMRRESLKEGLVQPLRRKSLEQSVAEAQVIVVATALDSAPAPPKVPGDLPENAVRFRVSRVLKGDLDAKEIITRSPTPADEFIGKEWIVMLSPEFLAGRHSYAGRYTIKVELEVKAILAKAEPLREREGLPPLEDEVAKAQVIVVATAIDSAPAPPKVKGDAPENAIRFRVTRVLKGKLKDEVITSRTLTAPEEYIGKTWILMLSPDFVAGKYPYASALAIQFEPTVKAALAHGETRGKRQSLGERPLEQSVADAEVIVVATALDATPAPAKRPRDLPESAIRFKVMRVLKGKLTDEVITIRHPNGVGAAADEFIGKAWVVMLSPEFVAGKHSYAGCYTIKLEAEMKAILAKEKK